MTTHGDVFDKFKINREFPVEGTPLNDYFGVPDNIRLPSITVYESEKLRVIEILKEWHEANEVEYYFWENMPSGFWNFYVQELDTKYAGTLSGILVERIVDYIRNRSGDTHDLISYTDTMHQINEALARPMQEYLTYEKQESPKIVVEASSMYRVDRNLYRLYVFLHKNGEVSELGSFDMFVVETSSIPSLFLFNVRGSKLYFDSTRLKEYVHDLAKCIVVTTDNDDTLIKYGYNKNSRFGNKRVNISLDSTPITVDYYFRECGYHVVNSYFVYARLTGTLESATDFTVHMNNMISFTL